MSVQLIWVDRTWPKRVCPSLFLSHKHGVVGHYTVGNGLRALKVIWLLTEYAGFCPCLKYLYQRNMQNINENLKSCISNVSQARFCLKCFAFVNQIFRNSSKEATASHSFQSSRWRLFLDIRHHCRGCSCLCRGLILRMLLSPHQSAHSLRCLCCYYYFLILPILSFQ